MTRKIFTALLVLTLALLTLNAAKKNDELHRMGIFISNFTELGMYDININDIGNADLVRFGIGHNVINNPKSTVRKCALPDCEYGPSLMSGSSVAQSVKKYFDLDVNNRTVTGQPEAIYDGSSYHFDARQWRDDTVYYAEVQKVRREDGLVHMDGELYNLRKKSDRPAYFTAIAKPYKYSGKNTWSILSLSVEWK